MYTVTRFTHIHTHALTSAHTSLTHLHTFTIVLSRIHYTLRHAHTHPTLNSTFRSMCSHNVHTRDRLTCDMHRLTCVHTPVRIDNAQMHSAHGHTRACSRTRAGGTLAPPLPVCPHTALSGNPGLALRQQSAALTSDLSSSGGIVHVGCPRMWSCHGFLFLENITVDCVTTLPSGLRRLAQPRDPRGSPAPIQSLWSQG